LNLITQFAVNVRVSKKKTSTITFRIDEDKFGVFGTLMKSL